MSRPSKDLFDDTPMTIGEHLEALRSHLWKALLGAALAIIICLCIGHRLIAFIRQPIDAALQKYDNYHDDLAATEGRTFFDWALESLGFKEAPPEPVRAADQPLTPTIQVEFPLGQLLAALHQADPERYPEPEDPVGNSSETVVLSLSAPEFAEFKSARDRISRPVALNVQEAFMSYMKVSIIAGFVFASPWVFYQLWLFVAAGLYRHERSLVYIYGGLSLLLFFLGAYFCFQFVFPFVLDFLLNFNRSLEVQPQIRLSEWISFAVLLPVMFGISFQLPLVMKFLQAINVVEVSTYREKRRIAIFIIAVLSVLLTPADPMSMLMMLFPLTLLYELGILLCHYSSRKNPFEAQPA